jgi:glycosyltransferase involved in cell wall biosynthesis
LHDINLLRADGHEVVLFSRSSDFVRGIGLFGRILAGFSNVFNMWAAKELTEIIKGEQPDIIHVHNTFPLISLWVLYAVKRSVPIVMTLHNYRLFCSAGIPLRDGQICTKCIDEKSVLPALKYGCYKGSRLATLPLAMSIWLHRLLGTLDRRVSAFITLTPYARKKFVDAGLKEDRVFIRANGFTPDHRGFSKGRDGITSSVLYVGRLSEEKGVLELVNAWREMGSTAPRLVLIGDGELRKRIEREIETDRLNIVLGGVLSRNKVVELISQSQLVVIPSICIEGLPTVLVESFSVGTPVLVSNVGPLPTLVSNETGFVALSLRPEVFSQQILEVLRDPEDLIKKGQKAREEYLAKYTDSRSLDILLNIYGSAMGDPGESND